LQIEHCMDNPSLIAEMKEMWRECFGDTERYTEYYFSNKMRDNLVFADFCDGHLVSMLHLNPYTICRNGGTEQLHYIVGVCTRKEFRHRGYMRRLLSEAFEEMKRRGEAFTYLMPADPKIYEPFDFRYVYTQDRLQMRLDRCVEAFSYHNHINIEEMALKARSFANEKDRQQIADFANALLKEQFDIYAYRDAMYYRQLELETVAADGGTLMCLEKDIPVGVVSWMAEPDKIEVVESMVKEGYTAQVFSLFMEHLKRMYHRKGALDAASLDTEKTYAEIPKHLVFLETAFIDIESIKKCLTEADAEIVERKQPIIMARALNEPVPKGRIYINEIV